MDQRRVRSGRGRMNTGDSVPLERWHRAWRIFDEYNIKISFPRSSVGSKSIRSTKSQEVGYRTLQEILTDFTREQMRLRLCAGRSPTTYSTASLRSGSSPSISLASPQRGRRERQDSGTKTVDNLSHRTYTDWTLSRITSAMRLNCTRSSRLRLWTVS